MRIKLKYKIYSCNMDLDIEEDLINLINNNLYIEKCNSNDNKDKNSLSYLIDRKLSQSECIKLGIGIEKILIDMVVKYTNLKNIKEKNKKHVKEKDHLFCDDENKIIYYAEVKANINLDTEKSKSTYLKCLNIVKELEENKPDYSVKWCLLNCRYLSIDNIPKNIKNKYLPISENVFGINQYLNMLSIDLKFNEESYKKFLNNVVTNMFS